MDNQDKTYNPIYITIPSLKRLIDLLSTRNLPKITVGDLESRKFAKSTGFQAIQGLKFLGVLDADGNTTEKARIFSMQGSGKEEKLEELIREAYSLLFATVPNAEALSRKELHDEFMAIYNLSGRLADSATPAFLWLCVQAGLKINEVIDVIERKPSVKKTIDKNLPKPEKKEVMSEKPQDKKVPEYNPESHIDLSVSGSGIILWIPRTPELESVVFDEGGAKDIRKAVSDFAKKYGLIKESLPVADKEPEDSVGLPDTGSDSKTNP